MKQELEKLRAMTTGLVVGGLAGVIIGMLMAPASGDETRQRLQDQAFLVREDARQALEQALEQARARAAAMQDSGRELIDDNKRRITRTVEAARDSAMTAWQADDPSKAIETPVIPGNGTHAVIS